MSRYRSAILLCALLAAGLPARAGLTPLVVGGEDAGPEFPWMAAVLEERDGELFQTCGASLLAPHWLITAAHCVDELSDAGPLEVMLDQPRLSDGEDDRHDISDFFIHPDFNSSTLDSDIALLRLAEPVSLDTVSIPDAAMQRNEVEITTSDNLELLGWGETGPDSGGSDELQHVRLDWIDNQSCNQKWGGNTVTENMICAWEPDPPEDEEYGQDACAGDSGGPLFITRSGYPWITGAVSAGTADCGFQENDEIRPSIYTRVINFVDWIEEITAAQGHPVVDARPSFEEAAIYYELNSQFSLPLKLRNDSTHNGIADSGLVLTLPDRLSLELPGEDWDCEPEGGDWRCSADDPALAAGESFTFDLVLTDTGDGEAAASLSATAFSEHPDYRRGNLQQHHEIQLVEEVPEPEPEKIVLKDRDSNSFPLSLNHHGLLVLAMLGYLRRSQLSSHSSRRSASAGAPRQAR